MRHKDDHYKLKFLEFKAKRSFPFRFFKFKEKSSWRSSVSQHIPINNFVANKLKVCLSNKNLKFILFVCII